MTDRSLIEQQLPHALEGIDIPELGQRIEGKVRDSYVVGDKRILITSDRISAFDVVLTTIPFKGELLNRVASHWFEKAKSIVPNHLIAQPHPNVFVAQQVEILPVEVIVRGYITGSAWRDYEAGNPVSGIELPAGLRKSQKFPEPLLTPSTKAERGEHDEPISSAEVVSRGLVEASLWEEVSDVAMKLFQLGTEEAAKRGLILVDTKYEFGLLSDGAGGKKLVLADEVHTQDSSRYWMTEGYEERFAAGEDPHMLDKEFVRGWLIEHGYMGEGTPPEIPDSFRVDTALRYVGAYEQLTGNSFEPQVGPPAEAIRAALSEFL